MPSRKRFKTRYQGVTYVEAKARHGNGKERLYFVRYKRGGRLVEEKIGRSTEDWTPAKVARERVRRIEGKAPTNQERRKAERAEKEKSTCRRLWELFEANTPARRLEAPRSRFRKYIEPTFGDRTPAELNPIDFDRLRIKLTKEGKSPATVRHVIALVRRLVNFGAARGVCDRLAFDLTLPRVNNQKTEYLRPEEVQALLKALDEEEDRQAADVVRIALFTGSRKSEILRLKWQDVDLERGYLTLRDRKGGDTLEIPLSAQAIGVFRRIPHEDEQYLFPARRGKGHRTELRNALNRIRERAGLVPSFRPLHGCRHHYATALASNGVPLQVIQRLLGHRSVKTTERYSHLSPGPLQEAARLAGRIIEGQAASGGVRESKGA